MQIEISGTAQKHKSTKRKGLASFVKEIKLNGLLYTMMIPGIVFLLLFAYLPMFGVIIAFKSLEFKKTFWDTLIQSPWVGFDNFEFFLNTPDAWRIFRNTIGYNVVFIIGGLVLTVALAIMLHELLSRKAAKFYQTVMFMPYFLSWVVVGYLAYAFLAPSGFINNGVLELLKIEKIVFYQDTRVWPYVLIFLNFWKYTGYGIIVYLASLTAIDETYYEAATIDGATKWKQIRHITLPFLTPMMVILTILAVGRIFSGDFGLFFNVTLNQGAIKEVTEVIDTYVYNALMFGGGVEMGAAAGLFQSVIGFILIMTANYITGKINDDNKLL
jgi:putative aldouronate transport system permease protein